MRRFHAPAAAVLALSAVIGISAPAAAQDGAEAARTKLTLSLQAEALSRTILWDEETRSSRLVNPQALLTVGYRAMPGLDLGFILGYSLASWNGLTFRGLPFSLENQAGAIGGPVLGAEIRKSLFVRGFWELELETRFTAGLGRTVTLPVEGLAVEGEAALQGTWMRIEAGPLLHYRGFEMFSPYLGAFYDRLWGRMTADEVVGDLAGSEEKPVKGAGAWALQAGTTYEPSESFRVRIGGVLIPFGRIEGGLGFDYGASLRILIGF
jgi:hypothetical protein